MQVETSKSKNAKWKFVLQANIIAELLNQKVDISPFKKVIPTYRTFSKIILDLNAFINRKRLICYMTCLKLF